MNLKYYKILKLLLVFMLIELSEQNEDASCLGLHSEDQDQECSSYCYDIVKPLLQYAALIYPKEKQFDELQEKVRDLEKTVRHMEETVQYKQKQLELQVELGNLYKTNSLINEELAKEKNKQVEDLQNQLKLTQDQITIPKKERGEDARNEDIQKLKTKLTSCENTLEKKETTENIKQMRFVAKSQVTLVKEVDQVNVNQTNEESSQVLRSNAPAKLIKTDQPQPSRELIIEKHLSNNCLGKSTDEYISTVLCDWKLAGSGWTVIQRRKDGSENFNRNWSDYKLGFGDLRGEFFIGLEKLSLLTQSQPHELYIYLEDFHNEFRYARYSNFLVGNESESYMIKTFGEYSGNADDALAQHKGFSFETPDRIVSSGNCAETFKSGWWFNLGCYQCNLNGPYHNISLGKQPSIEWRTWHFEPLKFVQMMIRPILH